MIGVFLSILGLSSASAAGYGPMITSYQSEPSQPGMANVTLHWFEQDLDHFNFGNSQTFRQRYFVYDEFWKANGPIFFYTGNEANVELYVNQTGLMWENCEKFGALLVFAEHRYYGESMPVPGDLQPVQLQWLTMEQALADFAVLISELRTARDSPDSAVIAFGGSYGGMLAAWLRMKYPGTVDGAIAGSAPILAFSGRRRDDDDDDDDDDDVDDDGHQFDGEAYWGVVTRDATAAAGAAPDCSENVRKAWPLIFEMGRTKHGRSRLSELFQLCTPLRTEADALNLALMHLNAWDTMAMGNFPYPSNYLVYQQTGDAAVKLPAFPVREACKHMSGLGSNAHDAGDDDDDDDDDAILDGLRAAGGVLYNVTSVQCFELPEDPNFDGIWDYQWCTELLPQETYFSRDGVKDMFWPYAENMTAIKENCMQKWGVAPREHWIDDEFNGYQGASNIVFSNGLYDPWSSAGVLASNISSVVAVVIPHGAHHLDLFFANPADPPDVLAARAVEMQHVAQWIADKA